MATRKKKQQPRKSKNKSTTKARKRDQKVCSFCTRPVSARNLCATHYRKANRFNLTFPLSAKDRKFLLTDLRSDPTLRGTRKDRAADYANR